MLAIAYTLVVLAIACTLVVLAIACTLVVLAAACTLGGAATMELWRRVGGLLLHRAAS